MTKRIPLAVPHALMKEPCRAGYRHARMLSATTVRGTVYTDSIHGDVVLPQVDEVADKLQGEDKMRAADDDADYMTWNRNGKAHRLKETMQDDNDLIQVSRAASLRSICTKLLLWAGRGAGRGRVG